MRPVTLTSTTTASDCQTPSGQIPGDESEQGIDMEGTTLGKKGKVCGWCMAEWNKQEHNLVV